MNNEISTTEYQIFIGCKDIHAKEEIITEEELRTMVTSFFEKNEVNFSMISLNGGYLYADGSYVVENTLCINIITDNEDRIVRLAKDLSMYMNQEHSLVVKCGVSAEYR